MALEEAVLEIARLRALLAEREAEVAQLRHSLSRMGEWEQWMYDVLERPSEQLSPAEKVTAIMTRREIEPGLEQRKESE